MKTTNLAIALALTTAMVMPAQTSSSGATSNGGDLFEVNLFGGAHFFKRQNEVPNQDLVNGGLVGFRFVQNFWEYVSLEQTGMVHGTANLEYRIPNTNRDYALGARLRQFHFNPVLHFKPREARIRPFVTMGFGLDWFGITDEARAQVGNGVNSPFGQIVQLKSEFRPAFNYGVGLKAKLTDRIGLRFDARGFVTASPDFGVPGSGPANVVLFTRTTPLQALQTTAGLTFYMGPIDQGPVCEFRVGSVEPSAATVWLTETANYRLGVTNSCAGVTPKYKWTMDGAPVDGTDMITVRGAKAGNSAIKVMVEADTTNVTDRRTRNFLKKFPIAAVERTATLTVKQPTLELLSMVINPSPIAFGQSATVTSTIRYDGPAAGENVTMTYTTTDGCLVPNGAAEAGSNCQKLTQMVKVAPGNTQHTVRLDTSKMTLTAGGPSKNVT
ncbi:MAG: hypothetical protein NW208_15190, partial [Bryobacter sp.]|nr:hypothetical protein [Bryobacter sp.]